MCGLAGFLSPRGFAELDGRASAEAMIRRIAHRGPDDEGVWTDGRAGVALGHRRLAILDLSPAGHQPMVSGSGRSVIAFNGEIYNYLELRAELEASGHTPHLGWRGHSDTEVLLAACEAWGVEQTLKKSVGMFAFALWARDTQTLTLARDRAGEKPLYYGWQQGVFLFGSELKALTVHPSFAAPLDRDALALYFRHDYIPAPWSIYAGVKKLSPGAMLVVKAEDGEGTEKEKIYWSLMDAVLGERFRGSPQEAVDELERRLRRAVGLQMLADVPLGVFLSGGIDSSTVAALMQAQSNRPVRTFSIGFEVADYNEAHHAANVARHLGTDHTELTVTPDDVLKVIPRIPEIWDEPFADMSQVPTFLLARLTRNHVTVSLSGDGGDELFYGYERYREAEWIDRLRLGGLGARLLRMVPLKAASFLCQLVPHPAAVKATTGRLAILRECLAQESPLERYRTQFSHWRRPEEFVTGSSEPPYGFTRMAPFLDELDLPTAISAIDAITYLPDDILVKVDRAAMAVSLETRVPLLDHRVLELAFSLPACYKVREGLTKWPLRQVLYRHVPRVLIDRKKMGFGVPMGVWLRGPLKEWAEELLLESTMRNRDILNFEQAASLWRDHQQCAADQSYHLWSVLMFRAWEETHGS